MLRHRRHLHHRGFPGLELDELVARAVVSQTARELRRVRASITAQATIARERDEELEARIAALEERLADHQPV
jgi:uncharacterized protein involved in exopolysaccharide biosynthesis